MRLAAVMDIVLEQMQQQPVGALGLHTCAAMHVDDAIRPFLVQRVAPGDQPAIDRGLRARSSSSVGQGIGLTQASGPSVPPSSAST